VACASGSRGGEGVGVNLGIHPRQNGILDIDLASHLLHPNSSLMIKSNDKIIEDIKFASLVKLLFILVSILIQYHTHTF